MNPALLSGERESSVAATLQTTQWNVLLHGLFIVQLAPGGDSSKIRIVLPYVNSPMHTHVYKAGHSEPWFDLAHGENQLLFNYKPASPPTVTKDDTDKIVIPSDSLHSYSPLNNLSVGTIPRDVFCWIDAPMPDEIHPLRANSKPPAGDQCAWSFSGTVGSGIKANQLPFLVALVYNGVDRGLEFPNFPGNPKPTDGNLFFFSEPDHLMDMDSDIPFSQMRNVLGLSDSELSFAGPRDATVCPAAPRDHDGATGIAGVRGDDEMDLGERNAHGPIQLENVHIRSCMALVVV